MKYYKAKIDPAGNTYSCDMVRLKCDFGDNSKGLVEYLAHKSAYDLDYEIRYFKSYSNFTYRHLWTIYSPYEDNVSFTVGLDLGNQQQNIGFVEFNPNKVELRDKAKSILHTVLNFAIIKELKRYDLAIDIMCKRSEAHIIRQGKRRYTKILENDGLTEYLGVHNTEGFVKLYDKTKESDLQDEILTRLEITLLKHTDASRVFPVVTLGDDDISLCLTGLTETDRVLIDLLRNNEDKGYYLQRLGYVKRKKIEPYLLSTTLSLDKNCSYHVKQLALAYE